MEDLEFNLTEEGKVMEANIFIVAHGEGGMSHEDFVKVPKSAHGSFCITRITSPLHVLVTHKDINNDIMNLYNQECFEKFVTDYPKLRYKNRLAQKEKIADEVESETPPMIGPHEFLLNSQTYLPTDLCFDEQIMMELKPGTSTISEEFGLTIGVPNEDVKNCFKKNFKSENFFHKINWSGWLEDFFFESTKAAKRIPLTQVVTYLNERIRTHCVEVQFQKKIHFNFIFISCSPQNEETMSRGYVEPEGSLNDACNILARFSVFETGRDGFEKYAKTKQDWSRFHRVNGYDKCRWSPGIIRNRIGVMDPAERESFYSMYESLLANINKINTRFDNDDPTIKKVWDQFYKVFLSKYEIKTPMDLVKAITYKFSRPYDEGGFGIHFKEEKNKKMKGDREITSGAFELTKMIQSALIDEELKPETKESLEELILIIDSSQELPYAGGDRKRRTKSRRRRKTKSRRRRKTKSRRRRKTKSRRRYKNK